MTLLRKINNIAFVIKLLSLSWSLSCCRLVPSCFIEHEHVVDSKNLLDRVSSSKRRISDKVILMLFVAVAQDKLILLDERQWLMLLGRIGLMLLKHQHVGFGDLSNLIGNPEIELEDLVRLNSPEDKKLMMIVKITWKVNAD
ncbi:hypothetical protein Tco_0167680 [Tanacetum coccineum]